MNHTPFASEPFELFSTTPLPNRGFRTIGIRHRSFGGRVIEIEKQRDGGIPAGTKSIHFRDSAPLHAALALAFDPKFTGARDTGKIALRGGVALVFTATRQGKSPALIMQLRRHDGSAMGAPLTFEGDELSSLRAAAAALGVPYTEASP